MSFRGKLHATTCGIVEGDFVNYRKALINWVVSNQPNYFVTLNFNYHQLFTVKYTARKVRIFANMLRRRLLGRNNKNHDWFFIAFPEHIGRNIHWHAMVRIPKNKEKLFKDTANDIWAKLVPSGQMYDLKTYNKEGAAGYCVKDIFKSESLEGFIIFS